MTLTLDADNTIYRRTTRHWHAGSENWAGADCLLTAIDNGWKVEPTAYCQEIWYSGARLVTIYHFELTKGAEKLEMPVITNPYARRLVRRLTSDLRPIEERDAVRRRQREG